MVIASRSEVAHTKREFPRGSRVVLDRMDVGHKPPIGSQGTVKTVDERGAIVVAWDNGERLNVLYGEDECHIVSTEEEAKTTLLFVAAHQHDGNPCPRCGIPINNPHTRALYLFVHKMFTIKFNHMVDIGVALVYTVLRGGERRAYKLG